MMKSFKVELTYGKKVCAFGTTVLAASEQNAIVQAKVLARLSGWPASPKKSNAMEVV